MRNLFDKHEWVNNKVHLERFTFLITKTHRIIYYHTHELVSEKRPHIEREISDFDVALIELMFVKLEEHMEEAYNEAPTRPPSA